MRHLRKALMASFLLGSTAAMAQLPGQLIIDPQHPNWLMRQGGGHVFICGPGDPEGFLYRGERQANGSRNGDQESIIRRLLEYGGNCLYMQIIRSHGGDGEPDHNPFLDSDPANELNDAILEQWSQWFQLMDDHGILIYLFLYDDSANPWRTGDVVGDPERRFITRIVDRFKSHRNLIWVVAEESEEAFSTTRANAIAKLIQEADDNDHLIGNHHHSGTHFKSFQLSGPFNHYSMQLNVAESDVYASTQEERSQAGPYQMIYAENTTTPQTVDDWRRHAWTVAMAGAMPMLLGMDGATTPKEALQQCLILSEFFEDTDFYAMDAAPEMANMQGLHARRNADTSWIAWTSDLNGKPEIQLKALPNGDFEFLWLDCVTGRRIEDSASVANPEWAFRKPESLGAEVALYASKTPEPTTPTKTFPGAAWTHREPEDVGLNADGLRRFAELAGGRGILVRDGYSVYQWGDASRSSDIASAGKPFYSHLLFRALEEGKLETADTRVANYRPCLEELNANLDNQDREMTFRHLAFQTACLGYQDTPGGAYDYNDSTMGFFWDTLINGVFGVSWDRAMEDIFMPELVAPLQFQDPFTFPTEGRMSGRIAMSPRDFARVGLLYLNDGRWGSESLISPRHARLARTDPLPLTIPRTLALEAESCGGRSIGGGGNQADHNGGYSWLWWTNHLSRDGKPWWPDAPQDLFLALGHCGQRGLAVFPTQRLIVSWNDARELHCNRELGNEAFKALLQSVED